VGLQQPTTYHQKQQLPDRSDSEVEGPRWNHRPFQPTTSRDHNPRSLDSADSARDAIEIALREVVRLLSMLVTNVNVAISHNDTPEITNELETICIC
jgi:hypothetical protein